MKNHLPSPVKRRDYLAAVFLVSALLSTFIAPAGAQEIRYYSVPKGSHLHDVAPSVFRATAAVRTCASSSGGPGRYGARSRRRTVWSSST